MAVVPSHLFGGEFEYLEAYPDIVMSRSTLVVPLECRSVGEGKTPRTHSPRGLATCVQIPAFCYFGAYVPDMNCVAIR